MACTGDTEAPGREKPHQGQKPLLKATDQARSRDRSKNEATQIPASMRQQTLEISSNRSQWNLSAAKAGGQQYGSSHKCQSSAPALLPQKSFKSEQLPHPSTLGNSPFPWAEVMKDAATVLICLRWKICLREKGARQHNAVPGEREIQALTLGLHPGWAANTVMIKQFSNNSCTAKQLSALVSRGFCSGL